LVVILAALVVVGQSSCESKFDVNAEWRDITIVFGLLNQSDSQHFIKINKAFLGPADAYEMALINDSSEYANLTGVVEQWKDGNLIKSHVLRDSTINNKESGTFYSPVQKVYYFNANLDPDSKYKLKIFFENRDNSDTVSAETEIINDSQLQVKFPPASIDFSFATGSDYIERDFKWSSAKDGKRYQISFLFDYYEIDAIGDSTLKTIKWVFPVQKTFDALGGDELKVLMAGEDFYELLASNLDKIDEDIVKRVPDTTWINNKVGVPLRYEISVAGEELSTYIDINSPSTGIVQEKPQYTNIQNGLGIFSARYKLKGQRFIDPSSIRELVDGSIGGHTTELGFCNPYLPDTDPKSCYYIP